MSKTNFFLKYLKNISNFINSLLEKNLNKLNFKNLSYLFKNNKIILTFVALLVIFITYLSLPNFYQQSDIFKKLQTELKAKFGINIKFSKSIKYNFFPSPHFITKDTRIFNNQNEISKIKKLKIFISLDNFLSLKNIEIKDLFLENTNFNLNQKNYNFFLNILDKNFQNSNLIIKDSNVFFKSFEDEVLFIHKIIKAKYYYEKKELKNILYTENEIFNIPFSIKTYFNNDKSKTFSQINLNLINLKIENELSLNSEKKIGKTEFVFNNLKRNVNYQIEKGSFTFHIFDKIDVPSIIYKGQFNLKPFYANLDGNLKELNLNFLFGLNTIIIQLLKTELLNHKNIDFTLNINADKISKNFNFKNIILKSQIKDGLIDIDKTKFKWRNFVDFEILQSLIFVRNGELILDGKLKINVDNYKDIYKFLLTPKNYRNEINQIDLNFTYNFDQKIAALKDIKIDNKINQNINKILSNIIIKKDDLQNKIYFKNLLNKAIKSYAG